MIGFIHNTCVSKFKDMGVLARLLRLVMAFLLSVRRVPARCQGAISYTRSLSVVGSHGTLLGLWIFTIHDGGFQDQVNNTDEFELLGCQSAIDETLHLNNCRIIMKERNCIV